jgi:hypothetical protein
MLKKERMRGRNGVREERGEIKETNEGEKWGGME